VTTQKRVPYPELREHWGFDWEFENGEAEGEAKKRDDGSFVTKK
jgi:hypothetical protein